MHVEFPYNQSFVLDIEPSLETVHRYPHASSTSTTGRGLKPKMRNGSLGKQPSHRGRGYGGKEDQGHVGSLMLTPCCLASILRCRTHLRGHFGHLRLKVSQALLVRWLRRRSMKQRATHNHVHFCRGKTNLPLNPFSHLLAASIC